MKGDFFDIPKCYATWAECESIRKESSSGGIFTLLATKILNEGGYVCGAVLDDRIVKHIIISDVSQLGAMRGSKYVYGKMGNCYKEIKKLLLDGKKVFFTGLPCQVLGLRTHIGEDFPQLLTADLICHGAPASKVWESYLTSEIGDSKLHAAYFRRKKFGWKRFNAEILSDKGNAIADLFTNEYMQAFLADLTLRPSCYRCVFAKETREGDITLGDFWGISNYAPHLDDNRGTSLILVNSQRGESYFQSIKDLLAHCESFTIQQAQGENPGLRNPVKAHPQRDFFFLALNLAHFDFKKHTPLIIKDGADIGILNNWNNGKYGEILSAYALQQVINELGYPNKLISMESGLNETSVFTSFAQELLFCTEKITTRKEMIGLNERFRSFLIGAGDVWSRTGENMGNYSYFGDFVSPNKKLVSYAASFYKVHNSYPRDKREHISCLLGRFDALSVRETGAQFILEQDFGTHAQYVLDPVLLHDAAWWRKITNKSTRTFPSRFVACVSNNSSSQLIDCLEGKTLIDANFHDSEAASVYDWLKTIQEAEAIVTDTLYGIYFAIIFERPFVVVSNELLNYAQLGNLLSLLHLDGRIVTSQDKKDLNERLSEAIDTHQLQRALSPLIHDSRYFLQQALQMKCENNRMNYATMLAIENRKQIDLISKKFLKLAILKFKLLQCLTWGTRRKIYEERHRQLTEYLRSEF